MDMDHKLLSEIENQLTSVLKDLSGHIYFPRTRLMIVGCSTSEVAGSRIGTSGSMEVAAAIYGPVMKFAEDHGLKVAFQCCEHLNRALVVDRETQEHYNLVEVAAIPVREAGGAAAAYAYRHMKEAVLVETLKADAGIDLGDTFIGMHLKDVVIPIRPAEKNVGKAHVSMAVTRPKLIGGPRAKYE